MTDAPLPAGPAPMLADDDADDASFAGPFTAPGYDPRQVRRWAAVVTVVLALAYLLLQNPYWVPGGDSDFYVSIARTLARGGGFEYNGLPVAISPPGWPWVMAKVMRLSPTFLALKLTTMLCMLGSLVIGYFVALRFLRPATAGAATLLCGLLMPVYSLTYFLHSEGLYCLLSALALLLALRLREGRGRLPGRIALVGLCVTLPLVRWAGVFQLLPIVAVLLSGGRARPWAVRHWRTALACTLVIVGTWLGTRYALRLTDEQAKAIREAGGSSVMDADSDEGVPSEAGSVTLIPVTKGDKQSAAAEYAQRVLHAGKWFSWLLWQPSRFASVSRPVDALVDAAGWGVILMLGGMAVLESRRGEYLWASLGLYCGGLCLNWPNPNARYFVPVAPLIVVGLFNAVRWGRVLLPTGSFDGWKWVRRGLVYSILLCNLAMYGVDVIVMRSTRFYDVFEAGQHKDLIDIAHYVMTLPKMPASPTTAPYGSQFQPDQGDIMINERYENLGKIRFSKAGSRALVLLTDRFVKPLEYGPLSRQIRPPFSVRLGSTLRRRGCEWLLVQAPTVPWRVWHFRLPQGVYQRLVKTGDTAPSGGWTLYNFQREDRAFVQQPVPSVDGWPTRVPEWDRAVDRGP